MGRPKQYDRNELLDRAIEIFRMHGFNGTSTADLVAELGVNRKSMYAEFGSKQELFEAALERYNAKNLSFVLRRVEAPDAGIEAIGAALDGYASAVEGPFRGRGCLMCNTAVERAALDPGSAKHVQAYLERLTRAFRTALGNAVAHGDLDPAVDGDRLAAFFTTAILGIAACVRAEAPPAQVYAATEVAKSVLVAYRRP